MGSGEVEICANCDREIGKLERAYVYENNVVCLECYNRLKNQESCPPPPLVDSPSQGPGNAVVAGPQITWPGQIPATVSLPQYAGFWRRFAAAFIDGILLNVTSFIIGFILGLVWVAAGGKAEGIQEARPLFNLIGIIIGWLYYALMESSAHQATLGKMAMGIVVTDMNGDRVSFARATGRHFAKFVSLLTLFIGFIMAGFTEKKQALHDMIASCLIVRKA